MQFSINKSKDDKFYVKLTGNNGEDIMVSEMYESKQYAKAIIHRIINQIEMNEIKTIDNTKK